MKNKICLLEFFSDSNFDAFFRFDICILITIKLRYQAKSSSSPGEEKKIKKKSLPQTTVT